jgi:DNA-binding LacI/PurR family transcriptional regulator
MKSNGKRSKQADIADQLRTEILSGQYAPGAKLPNQTELSRRFGVGNGTITLALRNLAREGFIQARPKAGTCVTSHPPHLNNIIVAQPLKHAPTVYWSKYFVALGRAVELVREELGRPIRLIEGFAETASAERAELDEVVRTHGLAGILFCYRPDMLSSTSILQEPGIPRVAVMPEPPCPGIDTALVIGHHFFPKALSALAALGRRRIGIVSFVELDTESGWLKALLDSYGMVCPPCWNIRLSFSLPEAARNVMRLMMRPEQKDRPDGLIIADDNLLEDAVAGLIAERARIPDDLAVVTHCNFPWPAFKTVPVMRLGTDVAALLRRAIELIDRRRRGEPIPPSLVLPAVWDPEVPEPPSLAPP